MGAGNTLSRIKGGTYTVGVGQAMYVDLDDMLVNNRLIPKVTSSTSDGGYVAIAEGQNAFLKGRKLYLFINDLYGHGGVLLDKNIFAKNSAGNVWIKQSPCRVYWDASTPLS